MKTDLKYAETHLRAIAHRLVEADKLFVEMVCATIGCTETEARHVLDVYRAEKVVKMDLTNSRWKVRHGEFWDADVLRRAVSHPLPAPKASRGSKRSRD